jgi:hypothetical protein
VQKAGIPGERSDEYHDGRLKTTHTVCRVILEHGICATPRGRKSQLLWAKCSTSPTMPVAHE